MTFKTPLIQTRNRNKLDTEAWRKTLDFTPPPKTRDQIAADAAAHALVKDTRDNRDPVIIGEYIKSAVSVGEGILNVADFLLNSPSGQETYEANWRANRPQ